MEVGLSHLIDEGSVGHVASSRFLDGGASGVPPQPDLTTAEGLHAARNQLSNRPPDPRAVERLVRAGGREVPVRIVTPAQGQARGVFLQVHGGGFYMDSAARSDARNVRLADSLRLAVVSVDYRLAPEHPWPAAPDDCETAARWLVDAAEDAFGTARILIGGTSAGANLAMATLLRMRDRGRIEPFAGAVLQFGAYDLSGQSPSGRRYAGESFIAVYAGHVADRTNPDISPLYGDLRSLPPVLLLVGALDILLEDTLAMAARLSAAGNEVDVRVYPESPHAFTFFPTSMAAAAQDRIEAWMAARLEDSSVPPA